MSGDYKFVPVFGSLSDPDVFKKHIEEVFKPGLEKKLNGQLTTNNFSINTKEPKKISSRQYAIGVWLFNVKDARGTIDGIFRDGFLEHVHRLGFMKRYKADGTFQYVLIRDNILEAVEIAQIRDALTKIIYKVERIDIDCAGIRYEATAEMQKEKFFRNSPSLFNDAVLGHLPNHTSPLLKDTATEMFFPFSNCVVSVTEDSIRLLEYGSMKDTCIWQDHIIESQVTLTEDYKSAKFADFIANIADRNPDRTASFESAIGYLLHNHSNPTTARAVIAYDEQLAKRHEPQGGSGKGVFAQALSQLRSVATIDGKKIKAENQFSYQQVNERTQVISFDDVKPDFDFLMLNSNLTTGWQIEHKHKAAFRFPKSDNPKTYITSNAILKADGMTAERRQFILTFSPFYMNLMRQKIEPILHVHGCMFFSDDWDEAEWNRFFSYMFQCCKKYLKEGLRFFEHDSVIQNKLIQQTSDDFYDWINDNPPSPGKEFVVTELYTAFRDQYYGSDSDFKQRTFTAWLKTYGLLYQMKYSTRKSNGKTLGVFNSEK